MTTINASNGLLFSFAQMEKESVNLTSVASRYLDHASDATGVINRWTQQLKNFQNSPPGAVLDWEIPMAKPICTIVSGGGYEPGGKGRHSLYGTVSAVWQIAIPAEKGRTMKRGALRPYFEIVGKASTRVCVIDKQNDGSIRELARWRFEIGNADSPGCHFHSQILGDDNDQVFPKSMPVPRLPNVLFTPMDALEFVLAELFQDEWVRHVARENDAVRTWAGCQRHRLITLLKWQQERLERSSGSPWTSLKAAKPEANLLV